MKSFYILVKGQTCQSSLFKITKFYFNLFSNYRNDILEVRENIIEKIFKKYPMQPEKISNALFQFSQIDKTIIEEVDVTRLLEVLNTNELLNWICFSSNFSSPKEQLDAIKNLSAGEMNNLFDQIHDAKILERVELVGGYNLGYDTEDIS